MTTTRDVNGVVEARMKPLGRLQTWEYMQRMAIRDDSGRAVDYRKEKWRADPHATKSETRASDAPGYRVLCGRQFLGWERPCKGLLGYAYQFSPPGEPMGPLDLEAPIIAALAGDPRPEPGDWLLFHHDGLRKLEDGSYRVLRPKKPEPSHIYGRQSGRRPMPAAVPVVRVGGFQNHSVIGSMPILPTLVHCPNCEVPHPNLVKRPGVL